MLWFFAFLHRHCRLISNLVSINTYPKYPQQLQIFSQSSPSPLPPLPLSKKKKENRMEFQCRELNIQKKWNENTLRASDGSEMIFEQMQIQRNSIFKPTIKSVRKWKSNEMKKNKKMKIRILERILNDIVVCLSLVPHLNRYKIYKSLEVVVMVGVRKWVQHKNGYELPIFYSVDSFYYQMLLYLKQQKQFVPKWIFNTAYFIHIFMQFNVCLYDDVFSYVFCFCFCSILYKIPPLS